MDKTKNIALVAHDNRKIDLMEWVKWNCGTLLQHRLVCTGTTGRVIEQVLRESSICKESRSADEVRVTKLKARDCWRWKDLSSWVHQY